MHHPDASAAVGEAPPSPPSATLPSFPSLASASALVSFWASATGAGAPVGWLNGWVSTACHGRCDYPKKAEKNVGCECCMKHILGIISIKCGIHSSYHPRIYPTCFCRMELGSFFTNPLDSLGNWSNSRKWFCWSLLERKSTTIAIIVFSLPSCFHLCLLHDIVDLIGIRLYWWPYIRIYA